MWFVFLANSLYPFILITMFSLFGFLVCFRGVFLYRFFEWDPMWHSEQRPGLFEVDQDLTSEMVDGSADEDIVASIVWLDKSCMGVRGVGWLRGCCKSLWNTPTDVVNHSDSEYQPVPFVNSSKWAPFGVFQLHGPLVKLLEQWLCNFWFLTL